MFENTTDLNCSSKKEKYTPAAINEIINLSSLYCLLNLSIDWTENQTSFESDI